MLKYTAALIGVALGGATVLARPADANDLLRLYQLAQAQDTTLQSARFQRDAAVEARPQALAQWLPQLQGTAAAERERLGEQTGLSVAPSGGPIGIGALPGCVLASDDLTERCNANYQTYGLTLSQTLWSYSAFSQLKEADFEAASAEASYRSAQQDLVLRVAQAYFNVLQASDQLTITRNERAAFATQLKQTQGREQTGLGSRSEVEQAQSYYDTGAQIIIQAQNVLDDARLALAQIIGGPPGSVAPLRDQIPLAAPDPDSADAWVASATQDNPDVRAAQLSAEAAERAIGVQRGMGLPSLSLRGTAGHTVAPLVLGGTNSIDTVGVYFSWPLFAGGAIASAVRQSRALYHQSQANLETAQRQTEQQTRAAYRNVVTGIQSIAATQRAVQSASDAVEAARRDIEFNVSSEFVLLSYQENYYTALSLYSQARYAYLSNVLILKQQAGRLSEHDLAMIDALLVTDGSGQKDGSTHE
ncbi:MAG TPA: TolC family outer membrane protein [Steroidobacteraceae bacterium]|jgi:outer membrane protein|nr:TolC family outer membrane protein [Steroidobacteraceae bacterium]